MNKEELYKLALSDVHKYSLLNEIFAIRDERFPNEQRDSTLCINGYIGLDVLNDYVELKTKINTYENPKDLTLMYMYCDEKAKDEIKELQNRIDKAIEYINKNWDSSSYIDATLKNKVAELNITELLEILKGENNE